MIDDRGITESSSLATTRSIEEHSIKEIRIILEKSPVTGNNSDIVVSHAVEIIEELWRAGTIDFVGNDQALGEIVRKLGRLASGSGAHVEYERMKT